jgi:hypothetical protein
LQQRLPVGQHDHAEQPKIEGKRQLRFAAELPHRFNTGESRDNAAAP